MRASAPNAGSHHDRNGPAVSGMPVTPPRKSAVLQKPTEAAAPMTEPTPSPANAMETKEPGLLGRLAELFGRKSGAYRRGGFLD